MRLFPDTKIRGVLLALLTWVFAPPVSAETIITPLSHLDCFINHIGEMECPPILAPLPQKGKAPAANRKVKARERQPPGCKKFRTYNPKTKTYRAYSGEIRQCR